MLDNAQIPNREMLSSARNRQLPDEIIQPSTHHQEGPLEDVPPPYQPPPDEVNVRQNEDTGSPGTGMLQNVVNRAAGLLPLSLQGTAYLQQMYDREKAAAAHNYERYQREKAKVADIRNQLVGLTQRI